VEAELLTPWGVLWELGRATDTAGELELCATAATAATQVTGQERERGEEKSHAAEKTTKRVGSENSSYVYI
jgi:hypothetical protein